MARLDRADLLSSLRAIMGELERVRLCDGYTEGGDLWAGGPVRRAEDVALRAIHQLEGRGDDVQSCGCPLDYRCGCEPEPVLEITREQWDAIPREQKTGRPGDLPMVLRLDPETQGTCLVPVLVA